MQPYGPPPGFPVRYARPEPQWPVVLMAIGSVLVGAWIVIATAAVGIGGWLVEEVLVASGQPLSWWMWPAVAAITGATVAAPAAVLWALANQINRPMPGVRAVARAWTAVGLATAVVGSVRAVPVAQNEILLLVTALAAAACGYVIRRRTRPGSSVPTAPRPGAVALGAVAGLLVLLPWLWAGALGGLTETLLAAVAAAAVGWLAASILSGGFFAGFGGGASTSGWSRVWQVLGGGLAAGVTLCPLGAAVGGQGVSLAQLIVLPSLGFAIATLSAPGNLSSTPVAVVVSLGALGPLAFVDPEETSIILGTADVGWWALVASVLSVLIGLFAGMAYGVSLRPSRSPRRGIAAGLVVVVALAAAGVYGFTGRPGLYGERLFVVMADQADLSGLNAIADRTTRVKETYRRLVDQAERTQAPLRASLDTWGLHYTPYYLMNAILVDGGPIVRQWLAARSDVDRVLLDERLRPLPVGTPTESGVDTAPDGTPLWNIKMIEADRAWSELGAQGKGIVIGTSDSGVDGGHPDLRDGFRGGDDSWYDPWNGTTTPTDHGGHGTHTIGTAVGRNGIGVAPQAQWIGCVNLDRNLGSPARYLDCLQFMLAPFPPGGDPWRDGRPERAPNVLTNSWGCPDIEGCDGNALLPATAALRAAGIFFVAAAGNTGPACSSVDDPPAPYADVFTVGAVDRQRVVTDFSSRGPTADGRAKPDLVAPGAEVLSALPDSTYGTFDGTSMAAPHVAGVVALMWSANPRLIGDIDTTARILRETTTPATPSYQDQAGSAACREDTNITGAGLVDAYAATQAARTAR
jgi:subtilisin family serine protease